MTLPSSVLAEQGGDVRGANVQGDSDRRPPCNAQVSALIEAMLRMRDRIGTMDRFQGQQAAIVIHSMTSSSPEEAPWAMEFLYDRHRLTVATSRPDALCAGRESCPIQT